MEKTGIVKANKERENRPTGAQTESTTVGDETRRDFIATEQLPVAPHDFDSGGVTSAADPTATVGPGDGVCVSLQFVFEETSLVDCKQLQSSVELRL